MSHNQRLEPLSATASTEITTGDVPRLRTPSKGNHTENPWFWIYPLHERLFRCRRNIICENWYKFWCCLVKVGGSWRGGSSFNTLRKRHPGAQKASKHHALPQKQKDIRSWNKTVIYKQSETTFRQKKHWGEQFKVITILSHIIIHLLYFTYNIYCVKSMIFIFTKPNGWLTFYRFYRSSNDHFDCIDLATPTATKETPKVGWFLLQKKSPFVFALCFHHSKFRFFFSEHIDANLKRWRIHVFTWWCTNLIYIHFQGVNLSHRRHRQQAFRTRKYYSLLFRMSATPIASGWN